MGPRSDFSKPCQGDAEKSANATRKAARSAASKATARLCLARGSQPVGMSTGRPLSSQRIRGLEQQQRRPQPAAETGRSCWGRVLIFQSPAKGMQKNQQTQPVRRRAAPQAKPQRGFAGLSFRTDDIGVAVGDEYKGAGAAHDGQIVFCIGPCFGADTDEGEDRVHKEQEQGRHQNAYAHTAPHTERADLFCIVIPAFAQGTGDHRSTADAEHRSCRFWLSPCAFRIVKRMQGWRG